MQAASHVSFDKTGGYGIDSDSPGGQFFGEGFSKADDAGFSGTVVSLPGIAHLSSHGGDVDNNPAFLFKHNLTDGLATEEDAGEIQIDNRLPVFQFQA